MAYPIHKNIGDCFPAASPLTLASQQVLRERKVSVWFKDSSPTGSNDCASVFVMISDGERRAMLHSAAAFTNIKLNRHNFPSL